MHCKSEPLILFHMTKIQCVKTDLSKIKSSCAALFLFEEDKTLPKHLSAFQRALPEGYEKLKKGGDFKGKFGELAHFVTPGKSFKRVLLAGCGKKEEFTLEKLRKLGARVSLYAKERGWNDYACTLQNSALKESADKQAQAFCEGALLSLYTFDEHKTLNKNNNHKTLNHITLVAADSKQQAAFSRGAKTAAVLAECTYATRDLINNPGNVITPTRLADEARSIARKTHGVSCEILSIPQIKKLKMGCFLSVARGSEEPPKFVILKYQPRGAKKTIVLVGKGVTFDSGGISIKPSEKMHEMKMDMSGAATVIETVRACALLKLPVRVIALAPCTENLPSGRATKPGDIFKAYNGKTVEVQNTDAEGRMILADALSYAARFKSDAIIDLATLTGAVMIALGKEAAGLLGNDEKLIDKIKAASEETFERVWQLPLWNEYEDDIKSTVADFKNIGSGRGAGTIIGAIFLKQFVPEKTPWAHIDIAAVAWGDAKKDYFTGGATGYGIRLLARFLESEAKN